VPTFDDAAVEPETIPDTTIDYFAYVLDWSNDGVDNLGDGEVDGGAESEIISIHVAARSGDVVRRAVAIVSQTQGYGIWDNALFGGPGDRGQQESIAEMPNTNHRLRVHGSVHILAEDLNDGDSSIRFNKNSFIHNNYEGLNPVKIIDLLPALPVDGDGEFSLEANLRVKNGLVDVYGNSELGQKDDNVDDRKELLDGIYSDDGFIGNVDGDGNPKNGFADTDPYEPYDPGLDLDFPFYNNDSSVDHMAYYLEDFSDGGSDYEIYDGTISIKEGESYYWNANDGFEEKGKDPGDGGMPSYNEVEDLLSDDEFFLWWDHNERQMVINGRIAIDGSFETEKKDVYYHGKGTIMAMDTEDHFGSNQVTIKTSLIPRTITDFNNKTFVTGGFPGQNLLGIMSSYKITFDLNTSESNTDLFGAFYCQDLIEIEEKANPATFIGGVASNRFKMKGNVTFVHVPTLDDSWEENMRMIGTGGVSGLSEISWVEVGVN
jgi:hypothetical protein